MWNLILYIVGGIGLIAIIITFVEELWNAWKDHRVPFHTTSGEWQDGFLLIALIFGLFISAGIYAAIH